MLSDRQNEILEMAKRVGKVTVDDLAARYHVSLQTIRKDLNELCSARLLARVHGGAVLSSSVQNVGYDARRMIAADEKAAIGRAVADLIPDNASLFINIGTTTEAVAQALLYRTGLMVITNNINVAGLLRPYPPAASCAAPTAASWAKRQSTSSASSRWTMPSSVPRRSIWTARSSTTTIGKCA